MTIADPSGSIHSEIDWIWKLQQTDVPQPHDERMQMKITRVLRADCPSGIDCDRIFDTNGPDVAVQGRVVTDPAALAALGLAVPPPGEAIVLVARHLVSELVDAHEAG